MLLEQDILSNAILTYISQNARPKDSGINYLSLIYHLGQQGYVPSKIALTVEELEKNGHISEDNTPIISADTEGNIELIRLEDALKHPFRL